MKEIEILRALWAYEKPNYTEKEIRDAIDLAIKALENQPRWIPVTERLPEESLNSVIGWDKYREKCVFVQYIDGHFQISGKQESFDIVAWMPLPEPYEQEENDNAI